MLLEVFGFNLIDISVQELSVAWNMDAALGEGIEESFQE